MQKIPRNPPKKTTRMKMNSARSENISSTFKHQSYCYILAIKITKIFLKSNHNIRNYKILRNRFNKNIRLIL